MKAISIKQPFASLILGYYKTVEVRKRKTNYRGDVVICSSAKPIVNKGGGIAEYISSYVLRFEMYHRLETIAQEDLKIKDGGVLDDFRKLPLGQALCIAELYDCVPMTKELDYHALCDTYDRAWAWKIKNIRPIEPFKVKGQLGLWNIDKELIKEI